MSRVESLKTEIDGLRVQLEITEPLYTSKSTIVELEEILQKLEDQLEGVDTSAGGDNQTKLLNVEVVQDKPVMTNDIQDEVVHVRALRTFGYMDNGMYKELVTGSTGYVPSSELRGEKGAIAKGVVEEA